MSTSHDSKKSSFYYNAKRDVVYRRLTFLGFPKYRVGTDGSVWSKAGRWGHNKVWRELKFNRHPDGHLTATVFRDSQRCRYQVHHLVLFAFIGPCPDGMQCRHWDGDPTNNRVENLRWGTVQQNAMDRVRHGRQRRGEEMHTSKLTVDEVKEIRRRYVTGDFSLNKLSKIYGVDRGTITCVVRWITWKHAK